MQPWWAEEIPLFKKKKKDFGEIVEMTLKIFTFS